MATAKNGKNSKKSAPKSRTQKSQSKPQKGENAKQAQDNTAKRQLYAIVLFCVSLLLLCLVFIKGESLWGFCRELMFGLFGFTSFIWPIILIYIAVMATLNKIDSKVGYKVAEAALLTVLISSAIHIFSFKGDAVDYFHDIADAYNYFRIDGSVFGSGAVGAILGGAILLITGSAKVPSAAIILVLIFLAVMLVTGTTLIKLINGFVNPAKKIGKMTNDRVHERFSSDGEEEEETEETPENDDIISYEEAQKKRKAKKQIDFVLPAEESGDEIPQAAEPLNSKPVQLDDIIKNMNSGNAEPKKAEPVKPAAEKTAEIKANDIPLGTDNKNDGENAEKTEDNYVLPTLDCLAPPKQRNETCRYS